MDKWVKIIGTNGHYEISTLGQVRSVDRIIIDKRGGIKNQKGLLLKPIFTHYGYHLVNIYRNGKRNKEFVHRLIAIHFIPNPNNYPQINHIDGNKLNNSLNNLEWCTQKMNNIHAYEHGLKKAANGEKQGNSRLKTNEVLLIRKLYEEGKKHTELSKQFNIDARHVKSIIDRRIWKHV